MTPKIRQCTLVLALAAAFAPAAAQAANVTADLSESAVFTESADYHQSLTAEGGGAKLYVFRTYGTAQKAVEVKFLGEEFRASSRIDGVSFGKNYTFTGVAAASYVNYGDGAVLTLGGENTRLVSISMDHNAPYGTAGETKGQCGMIGLWAYNQGEVPTNARSGAQITVNADTFEVNLRSSGWAYGIYAQNSTTPETSAETATPSTITINAENTVVNVEADEAGAGLVAMSEGRIYVNGNISVTADKAIVARGHSVVSVNASGDRTVKLTGDIDFNYDKATSGTAVDSDVTVNLTNAGSSWVGNAICSYDTKPAGVDTMRVSGLSLTVANGAQWTATYTEESSGDTDGVSVVAINDLTLDGGVISVARGENGETHTVRADNVSGSGGVINLESTTADGKSITAGGFEAKNSSVAALDVNFTGITADDITDAEAAFASAKDLVQAEGTEQTLTVAQGDVMGALTQKVAADGTAGAVVRQTNTRLEAFAESVAISTVMWRHETNDLMKRMGELRDSPEGVGTWARLYGSEMEFGAQKVTQKSASVQVGADVRAGGWVVGGAFAYTDGSTDYADGSGDTDAWTAALYGTHFADNGMFVDLIGRWSRLENDFEIDGMRGGVENNAWSLGAEFGWRFELGDTAYVEPQAELTWGRIEGDDTVTSNGVRIAQDDTDALLGRLGVRAGLKFPGDRGSVYARLSGVRDFEGESSAVFSKDGLSERLSEDLGGGWVEYAVGANFRLTPATAVYADLERTSGGEVKENWRWNVGLRTVW